MNRTSFYALLDRIIHHPIFLSTSFREQREPKFQLQVALYYFGGGSSGSRIRTALLFRIAEGTVEWYVWRVTIAVLSLQEEYIRWPKPDSEEYRSIVRRHQVEYGFPNCLGFVDGTLITVYRKLIEQGERYHTRKGTYALHTTLVVDSMTRILFVCAGRKFLY